MEPLKIVEKFQCPGCVCGADTSSGCYEPESGYFHCSNHVPGTIASGIGTINLGLPKGFNRIGGGRLSEGSGRIRLFKRFDDHPGYNHLNVPVWVMEKSEDGIDFNCQMLHAAS